MRMSLDEAIAVHLTLKNFGYPKKSQIEALAEADRIIMESATKAVERFTRNSAAPG